MIAAICIFIASLAFQDVHSPDITGIFSTKNQELTVYFASGDAPFPDESYNQNELAGFAKLNEGVADLVLGTFIPASFSKQGCSEELKELCGTRSGYSFFDKNLQVKIVLHRDMLDFELNQLIELRESIMHVPHLLNYTNAEMIRFRTLYDNLQSIAHGLIYFTEAIGKNGTAYDQLFNDALLYDFNQGADAEQGVIALLNHVINSLALLCQDMQDVQGSLVYIWQPRNLRGDMKSAGSFVWVGEEATPYLKRITKENS